MITFLNSCFRRKDVITVHPLQLEGSGQSAIVPKFHSTKALKSVSNFGFMDYGTVVLLLFYSMKIKENRVKSSEGNERDYSG